mmetsp:Transcript_40490/g.86396  ORF Transcript_40490/g.86396 Transcript_40490/m.86396 type:complete len:308 (+) Transcript_40490:508-1431(+)
MLCARARQVSRGRTRWRSGGRLASPLGDTHLYGARLGCEAERGERLVEVSRVGRDVDEHERLGIARERTLQHVRQFGVAERHMRRLLGRGGDDISERCEALVDGVGLTHRRAVDTALLRALRASEVDEVELALARRSARRVETGEPKATDGVRARGVLIELGGGGRARGVGGVHEFLELLDRLDAHRAQPGHGHHALGVRDLELRGRARRCALAISGKEISQLVVVDLHERGGELEAPAEQGELPRRAEDLLCRARNKAARRGRADRPLHGVRLARARLPVREDADAVAVDRRLREARHLAEDIFLR